MLFTVVSISPVLLLNEKFISSGAPLGTQMY